MKVYLFGVRVISLKVYQKGLSLKYQLDYRLIMAKNTVLKIVVINLSVLV